MADPVDRAVSMVPDLFFDLIARIFPGATVLSYIIFVLKPEPLVAAHNTHSIWFLLVGGYIVGLALTSISLQLFDHLWSFVFRRNELTWDRARLFAVMEQALIVSPRLGNRMWKNYAEMILCEGLFVGFAAIAVWELCTQRVTWTLALGWLGVLAALLTILYTRVFLVRFREKYAPKAIELATQRKSGV